MKNFSKALAMLVVVVLVISAMSISVFAADNTITVNNTTKDAVYNLYKMLNLDVNSDETAYTYTVATGWNDFFTTGEGAAYVDIDGSGYVTWKAGKETEAEMINFGKNAAAYAAANASLILSTVTEDTDDDTVVFTGLDNGYYLVTSSLGTKAIVLTAPNTLGGTTISEKNSKPTVDKKVHEDSDVDPNSWATFNDASIDEVVNFQTTITVGDTNVGYVLHDKMDAGLTYNAISSVKIIKTDDTEITLATPDDYTVNTAPTDNDTFDITFVNTSDKISSLVNGDKIVVEYNATLNKNAVVGSTGNKNDTYLQYGNTGEFETLHKETETYTWEFDIVKTDGSDKILDGAQFDLYDAATDGNKLNLVKVSDGVYRLATAAEAAVEGFVSAPIETVNGCAKVTLLDSGSYFIEETVAPAGYNKLASRVEVQLNETTYADKIINGVISANTWEAANKGVHITNLTGSILPGTGGIGTTVFYVVGGIMVLAAVIFLVVKKRMSVEAA